MAALFDYNKHMPQRMTEAADGKKKD